MIPVSRDIILHNRTPAKVNWRIDDLTGHEHDHLWRTTITHFHQNGTKTSYVKRLKLCAFFNYHLVSNGSIVFQWQKLHNWVYNSYCCNKHGQLLTANGFGTIQRLSSAEKMTCCMKSPPLQSTILSFRWKENGMPRHKTNRYVCLLFCKLLSLSAHTAFCISTNCLVRK